MTGTEEIFAAVQAGDSDRVEALLCGEPRLIEARDAEGASLLMIAAYAGRRSIFELLLARGAGVGLFEASALGLSEPLSATLVADPARVNEYSPDGWTPLHLAAFFGQLEAARILLDGGAEVDARSRSERFGRQNTPLHAAAANRQIDVARLLIERGADINAKDGSGFTPLGLAAGAHNDLLVIALLEKGARIV